MNANGEVGECAKHGEFFMDAKDSPCPSCEDEAEFCDDFGEPLRSGEFKVFSDLPFSVASAN